MFYTDYDKIAHGARVQSYLKAMEAVAQRYPDDDEAQLFYAITLNVAASPTDKTYSNQLKGAAILEQIFKRQPRHPGVAHYLIHLYDYAGARGQRHRCRQALFRDRAGRAARAAHALAHLHARRLLEGIDRAPTRPRRARRRRTRSSPTSCMPWTTWSMPICSSRRTSKARGVVDEMNAITGVNPNVFAGPYALAASPARYMVERGDWKGAAELPVRPTQFAHVQAMTHFARALGAARSGNPDAAKADIAKLAELRDKLREAKDAYWAEQVDIQRQVATAFLLDAEGKPDDALKAMSAAADAEDKTEKSPVTPGVPEPARELYGIMLLERGMAREALAAFEATIKKEPNRFNAIAGAAKAAERLGDKAKAKDYYQKLTTLAGNADTVRPDLAAARAFLAKN